MLTLLLLVAIGILIYFLIHIINDKKELEIKYKMSAPAAKELDSLLKELHPFLESHGWEFLPDLTDDWFRNSYKKGDIILTFHCSGFENCFSGFTIWNEEDQSDEKKILFSELIKITLEK